MIVKCISNKGASLPADMNKSDSDFDLIVGKYYVVYGMVLRLGYIWYYILEDEYIDFTFARPSPLFEIYDGRLSKYWIYSFELESQSRWNYPEWINGKYYYDILTDGDKEHVLNFKHYKTLMDLEFPFPTVPDTDKAILVQDKGDWLICPFCLESWEQKGDEGMVVCKKCEKILHNPLYVENDFRFRKLHED